MQLLALFLSGPVLAADFSCAQPTDFSQKGRLDELDEVVITGLEATTRTKDLQAWLRLLVGQYTYEGYVDLCGNGNAKDQRTVTGKADCIGSGPTPNVHCKINVRWPATTGENGLPVLGGVSNLSPALVSFSLENRFIPNPNSRTAWINGTPGDDVQTSFWGLMFMQVDNEGIAEWGSGELVGDAFTSREACVGIPGTCQKITRITAKPDSDEISMVVDTKVESRLVLRQGFLLHREPIGQKNEQPGKSSP